MARLVAKLDEIAPRFQEEMVVQHGHTNHPGAHLSLVPFLTMEQMQDHLARASLVVCTGGWGTISECMDLGKRIVAVPRIPEIEAHHDQSQLVASLEQQEVLLGVYELDSLEATMRKAMTFAFGSVGRGQAGTIINEFLRKEFPHG